MSIVNNHKGLLLGGECARMLRESLSKDGNKCNVEDRNMYFIVGEMYVL
jgi:hypothetical protein